MDFQGESNDQTSFAARPRVQYALAGALLAWYFVSALSAMAGKSAAFDEPFCLTGGYSYWLHGDFRVQPENGNLPQRWATLPLMFGGYAFPSTEDDAWQIAEGTDALSDKFLYMVGNDADAMMFRGRVMIALLGVALGAVIFGWTRRLLGVPAAFVSLALFAFCPTMLTIGTVVTTDMAATLFFTLTVGAMWMILHRVTWKTLLASTLILGGMFVAKFSAVLIVFMAVLLITVQLASGQPMVVSWRGKTWQIQRRAARLAALVPLLAAHAAVVWVVIWASFNFRYEMFAHTTLVVDPVTGKEVVRDKLPVVWDDLVKPESGVVDRAVLWAREHRVLPEAYLYGFAYTYHTTQERHAFLNGEFSMTGWPQFFPYCLLVKTPLTLFALMGLGVAALAAGWWGTDKSWLQRRRRAAASLYRSAPLWVLFVVYWAFAIPSHINIGHRHITPTYPPMLMLAGAAALWWQPLAHRVSERAKSAKSPTVKANHGRLRTWFASRQHPAIATLVVACVALFALESLAQWPNYLAYFNQLAGGSRYAYRHLVDSSLDWGQELPALKKFLEKNGLDASPTENVYLAYFGAGKPSYYEIKTLPLPGYADRTPPHVPQPLQPGTYVISATMLQCVFTMFPYRWNNTYENVYQQLRQKVKAYDATANDPAARQELIRKTGGEAQWLSTFRDYEQARFARLASFLRRREPDEQINYSMFVYRLNQSYLDRALDGAPPIDADKR